MKKNKKVLIILASTALAMFFFGFALVPLYQVFCKVTGLNGRVFASAQTNIIQKIDYDRTINVIFIANKNENLPWDFYPLVSEITIHPGEVKKVFYYAKNPTPRTMTIQAIPSTSPGIASKYLSKTECFCFTQQTFEPQQSLKMPVIFTIDNNLPKDINTITLSYTLFDVKSSHVNIKKQGRIQ